jgi:cyclophilin family peptidyl-prolyl cis-trans isomerase
MVQCLKRSAQWEMQYYAIPLASIIEDSLLTDRIASLTKSKNPQVALTALKYLAYVDKDLAISYLLERFGSEKKWYIRGHIIKILAEQYPEKAYSFVMQNLDKGDSQFKSQLLEALANLKSKMAISILKQFINVDDPVLVCSAFENLKSLGLLNKSDIDVLLDSDHFTCVATALGYLSDKRQNISTDRIIKIYKEFNSPSEFEVQASIIKILKNNLSSSPITVDTLIKYASHDVLRRRIIQSSPKESFDYEETARLGFEHANWLLPDSIIYYSKNPTIRIQTKYGKIKIELYAHVAPYTVNNFIRLIENDFYDGLTFHRIIPDFVSQSGDPLGSGWGGPDYLIPSEDNWLSFIKGSVGIATSGFDTGSSQFFICHSEQPHLNGNYTLFGQVVDGMNIVYSILPEDKILDIEIL